MAQVNARRLSQRCRSMKLRPKNKTKQSHSLLVSCESLKPSSNLESEVNKFLNGKQRASRDDRRHKYQHRLRTGEKRISCRVVKHRFE